MDLNLDRTATILAVDDCKVTQKAIKKILGSDYQVLVASNAKDAFSTIYQQHIDILLLDVSMPEVDGLEFCRTVRQLPQFAQLPIVMLTARNEPFDKVKGLWAGATEYLTKPFNADRLYQLVESLVAQREGAELNEIHKYQVESKNK